MRIFGILMLIFVGSNTTINKLFFSGPNIYIECPGDGTFYHWKKYHLDELTNLFSDDKRRLLVPLKVDLSPTTYECSGTNGFNNYKANITIFVLDQQSPQAQKLCFMDKLINSPTAQYPCFLVDQSEPVTRITIGSTVSLNCEAGGINVTYNWYKLSTPDSYQELMHNYANVSVLRFVNVDNKVIGQYLCIVNTTTGNTLKRVFDIQMSEIEPQNTNMIFVSGPAFTNVTVTLHTPHRFTCHAEALEANTIHLILWVKKLNPDSIGADKSLVIKWGNSYYKLLPEAQVLNNRDTGSSVTTSLVLESITVDSVGQYICAFFTNDGKMKHKSFDLYVDNGALSKEATERGYLSLYILIPSLIIAVCLFVGIYLTINRISARNAQSHGSTTTTSNCCKSDNETVKLRNTPDYSINSSYPSKGPPPTTQYMMHSPYPSPYYPGSDKVML